MTDPDDVAVRELHLLAESLPGAHLGGTSAHLRLGLVWRSLVWTHWIAVTDGTGDPSRAELLLER